MHIFSFDIIPFIKAAGVLGVGGILFAETGLLLGFFLPGDSLLFTAGILASQGYIPIIPLLIATFLGAIFGDSIGYALGKKIGPKIFSKQDSLLFNKEYIQKTHGYFERYGAKTILIARFIPIVRTLAPVLAGVGSMNYKTFLSYNIAGAFFWGTCIPLLGYILGSSIPNIDRYLLPIILGIIIVSFLPALRELVIHSRKK